MELNELRIRQLRRSDPIIPLFGDYEQTNIAEVTMHFMRRWLFTLIGGVAALMVLGIEKIDGFYLFVTINEFHIDVIISALLIAAGILLDLNLCKLERERAMERQLRQANEELDKTNTMLRESLAKIKILKGLFPICASCKKIRDDKGYWQQVEVYLRGHTDAEFTHWLCPECVTKLRHRAPRRQG